MRVQSLHAMKIDIYREARMALKLLHIEVKPAGFLADIFLCFRS
jgi:hypothetical protein